MTSVCGIERSGMEEAGVCEVGLLNLSAVQGGPLLVINGLLKLLFKRPF